MRRVGRGWVIGKDIRSVKRLEIISRRVKDVQNVGERLWRQR